VAGQHFGFVGEGQKAGLDGVNNLTVVSAGQIRAADAAGKEGIAGDDHLERGKVEADGALGVAGGVQDLSGVPVQAYAQAVGEGFVRGRGLWRGDAQPIGLSRHHFEQGQIVLIEQDGRSSEALEPERAAYVVDVGVCDENLLELEAEFCKAALDAADLVAGIDDDGLAGFLIAQDSAVAFERADGEGFKNHGYIVERGGSDVSLGILDCC